MTDTQHYQRIKDLYDRLDADGKKTVRDLYPECFTVTLPKDLNSVYDCIRPNFLLFMVNAPESAETRLRAFADLLCVEYALNEGLPGKHTCAINPGDEKPVAFHPMRRDQNPSYRLPIFLDQEKMNHALEHFPDLFNTLVGWNSPR